MTPEQAIETLREAAEFVIHLQNEARALLSASQDAEGTA